MELKSVSTDRVDEIRQSIGTILKELLTQGSNEMETYFEKNTDAIVDELYQIMQGIYLRVHEAQQQKKFGKISYIRVFPRRVAIIDGTYSFTIRVYDEEDYRNPIDISAEWNPEFLVKLFERQLARVEKQVVSQVFKLTTREAQLVKLLYGDAFNYHTMMFLTILRAAFVYVENIMDVECADKIVLTFGNYLEQGVVVEVFENPGGGEA